MELSRFSSSSAQLFDRPLFGKESSVGLNRQPWEGWPDLASSRVLRYAWTHLVATEAAFDRAEARNGGHFLATGLERPPAMLVLVEEVCYKLKIGWRCGRGGYPKRWGFCLPKNLCI
jgi:hypothetical protein